MKERKTGGAAVLYRAEMSWIGIVSMNVSYGVERKTLPYDLV
jgi:hypothetical protein